MRIGVQHCDREIRQLFHNRCDRPDAHAGVKQQGPLRPHNEIGYLLLPLFRFVKGNHAFTDVPGFKPVRVDVYLLQRRILVTRQLIAPLGGYRVRRGGFVPTIVVSTLTASSGKHHRRADAQQ